MTNDKITRKSVSLMIDEKITGRNTPQVNQRPKVLQELLRLAKIRRSMRGSPNGTR